MPTTRSQLSLPAEPPRSPYPYFRRVRDTVALLDPWQEAIIEDIPREWAAQVIDSVESQGTRKELFLRYLFSSHVPTVGRRVPYKLNC